MLLNEAKVVSGLEQGNQGIIKEIIVVTACISLVFQNIFIENSFIQYI